jgi:hypothetical protein
MKEKYVPVIEYALQANKILAKLRSITTKLNVHQENAYMP